MKIGKLDNAARPKLPREKEKKKVHILEFGTFSSFFDPGNIPMKIRRLLYPFKKYFGDTLTDNIIPFFYIDRKNKMSATAASDNG
jgi:hypothetical protein